MSTAGRSLVRLRRVGIEVPPGGLAGGLLAFLVGRIAAPLLMQVEAVLAGRHLDRSIASSSPVLVGLMVMVPAASPRRRR